MKVMVLVKGNEDTEAGVMPTEEELAAMGSFNEELVKAGIMLDGDGLHPSSRGVRITYGGEQPSVTDGPFAETKELVAGYWVLQVRDMDEAVEWLKRAPFNENDAIELRRVFEAEDFGEAYTPELRERDEKLRSQIEGNA